MKSLEKIAFETFYFVLQGVGFARMSQLCREGELIERCYGDVGTMLEAFERGARVSGKQEHCASKVFDQVPYILL